MRAIAINALIIIVLAITVLISTVAFYYPTFISSEKSISSRSALDRACVVLQNNNCKLRTGSIQTANFDADKDGNVSELARDGDNLFMLCRYHYQTPCTTDMVEDINKDCIIENKDFDIFIVAYGSECKNCISGSCWGDYSSCEIYGKWNPSADLNVDGYVGADDLSIIAGIYGTIEPEAERACKKLCGC